MEGTRPAWRFRIAKMVPFWNRNWPPWQPSWKSLNHICSKTEVWISLNMIAVLWKFRIAKIVLFQCPRWPPSWKSSNYTSYQNRKSDWVETWREASGWHGESEWLHRSVSISKMVALVEILKLFKQHQILVCWILTWWKWLCAMFKGQ